MAGTKFQTAEFLRWAGGRIAGNIVLSRDYFVRQVTSLLKFAKETTNPQLAAVLIEKAADLKSQVDESSTTPDLPSNVNDKSDETCRAAGAIMTPQAPDDAQPER